ncbi:MAG: SxtJ family membrane protein, partial [Planctomycetota bacterium]
FWTLTKYGRFLHADLVVEPGKSAIESAYHNLANHKWFFDLTTRMTAFRIFATLSPLFLFFALAIPKLFGRYWLGLGTVLGTVMTPIFISIIFYVGFAPLALVMKVMGKDPLNRGKQDGSYWIPRAQQRKKTHFEHLF